MSEPEDAAGLRALAQNRQMPDANRLTVTLGELRAALASGDEWRGLPNGIMERDAEWANAMPGKGPRWTRAQLAEAYLLAGMDRRALLERVGLAERELRP